MRSLSFAFLLVISSHHALGEVGFFAFEIDFEHSGIEFKQKVAEFRMAAKADGFSKYMVANGGLMIRTSAFHMSQGAKTRIPTMLVELRNSLCFLDPFHFPIKETSLSGPSHARNDTLLSFVAPTHRRLRELLLDTVTRYGILPFEEEQTEHFRSEDRSPNMIIVASIPMTEQTPALNTGRLISEVKLRQSVTVYQCMNEWSDMDCAAVKSDYIMTPCKN
uniref:Uncharacterized protein n=1 Tax=Pristionchus pacificus TaxID=54126 RepID=A0A8R1ZAH7_PRIPA